MGREFARRDVMEALDAMTIDAVCRTLYSPSDDGEPTVTRVFAQGQGSWRIGDGRPTFADEDPAVMQAIGRCAAYRVRLKMPGVMPLVAAAHPKACAWCEYPVAELLRACDWATVTARYVVTERLTWRQYPNHPDPRERGQSYHRGGRDDVYLNDAWAAFWALDAAAREARIAAAQYPEAA